MKRIITNKAIFALTLLVGSMAMANGEGLGKFENKMLTAQYCLGGLGFLGLGKYLSKKKGTSINIYKNGILTNTYAYKGGLVSRIIGTILLAPVISLLPMYFGYKLPTTEANRQTQSRYRE